MRHAWQVFEQPKRAGRILTGILIAGWTFKWIVWDLARSEFAELEQRRMEKLDESFAQMQAGNRVNWRLVEARADREEKVAAELLGQGIQLMPLDAREAVDQAADQDTHSGRS